MSLLHTYGTCAPFALCALAVPALVSAAEPKHEELNYVFQSGTNGYHTFRIPAIIQSNKGTLIAFAEGRVNNSSDHGNLDIVARRSTDNGKTWSDLILVQDDGNNQCGNPAPVVDQSTGRIYLLSCGSNGSEGAVLNGQTTREVYSQYSDDDGLTWSKRENISQQVKKPDWRWYATGPCSGIQIQTGKYKGRLVIPANHSDAGKTYRAHCFYSDDHGKTWKLGSTAGDGSNESQIAEIAPGKLVHNMRMQTHSKGYRGVRYSSDGGATWTDLQHDANLPCPRCQASVIRDYARTNALYFSNPTAPKARKEMSIRSSTDGGKTWPYKKVVFPGNTAYSNLLDLDKNSLGILFEAWQPDKNGIVFSIINKKDLRVREK